MITNRNQAQKAISWTQFLLLFWGCLLSPLVETFFSQASQTGGRGAFLLPLLLLPFLCLWGKFILELGGASYLQGIEGTIGVFFGKILVACYGIWGVILLAYQLQLCGMSFLSVGYQQGSYYVLLPLLALFVFWMSGCRFPSFARSSSFFFAILLTVIILVLGLSLSEISLELVLPLWTEDIPALVPGSLSLLGILGYGIYTAFFLGEVTEKSQKSWVLWAVIGCVATALALFIATGVYGQGLLSQVSQPFFQLAKGIRIFGGFQRMESLVMALWTLADFILLGVLLRATACCLGYLLPGKDSSICMAVILVISTLGGLCYPQFPLFHESLILGGNILLAWVCPLLLILLKKLLH